MVAGYMLRPITTHQGYEAVLSDFLWTIGGIASGAALFVAIIREKRTSWTTVIPLILFVIWMLL
jgi:hypothetical protein